MDTMTPEQLLFIFGLVVVVGLVRIASHFWRDIARVFVALLARAPRHDYGKLAPIASVSKGGTADTNAVPAVLGTSTVPASVASRDDIIKAVASMYPDKSGNDIAAFFGGKRADVLALVRAVRGGASELGPLESGVNPISGRRTTGTFDDLSPLVVAVKPRREAIDEETGMLIYID